MPLVQRSDSSSSEKDKDVEEAGKEVAVYASSITSGAQKGHFSTTSVEHRKFETYHVNLLAIGGTIGTAVFVLIGTGLTSGGPLNLVLAFSWWVSVVWAVAECQKELVVQWPTDAAFSRHAARYVDEAAGFALGWNFFFLDMALAIFEVTACCVVLSYWPSTAKLHEAVIISIVIGAYALFNLWDARYFANAEFALAMGKILLIIGLLLMTFVTMLGANPIHDRFGFRFWKEPGPLTGPYPENGESLNRFQGFLSCLIIAAFAVGGPEYLSVVAAEARNPRKSMPRAFNATVYRLVIFFIGSALAVGILVPYNDPNLLGAQAAGAAGAGRSPYVIAMDRLQIPFLPHIVNGAIFSSVFSAGNAYFFCASRQLAQMARDGHAPKFLNKLNRNGVPYPSVIVCLALLLLSYTQVSSSAAVLVDYLTSISGSGQMVNWIVFSYVWLKWYRANKVQGISRDTLPCRSPFQPYAAYYALVCSILVTLVMGYEVFLKGQWDTASFFFSYGMPILYAILFTGYKLIKRTKWQSSMEADVTSLYNDPEFTEYIDYATMDKRGRFGSLVHKVFSALF
ncbi:hypothetical protein JCM6882_003409 [Rhodosporidiobolus microsporus]